MEPGILWQGLPESQELIYLTISWGKMILHCQTEVVGTMFFHHLLFIHNLANSEHLRWTYLITLILKGIYLNLFAILGRLGNLVELVCFNVLHNVLHTTVITPVLLGEPADSHAIEIAMGLLTQVNIVELIRIHRYCQENVFQLLFREAAGGRNIQIL